MVKEKKALLNLGKLPEKDLKDVKNMRASNLQSSSVIAGIGGFNRSGTVRMGGGSLAFGQKKDAEVKDTSQFRQMFDLKMHRLTHMKEIGKTGFSDHDEETKSHSSFQTGSMAADSLSHVSYGPDAFFKQSSGDSASQIRKGSIVGGSVMSVGSSLKSKMTKRFKEQVRRETHGSGMRMDTVAEDVEDEQTVINERLQDVEDPDQLEESKYDVLEVSNVESMYHNECK